MGEERDDRLVGGLWAEHVRRSGAAVPPRRAQLRRVAAATRAVIDGLVATRAPLDALERAAAHVEAAAAELGAHPRGRPYEGFAEAANAGDTAALFDHSPVMGAANPLAPPLEMEVRDGVVRGRVRFGAAYEGPPNTVHGGYLAATFDELLGLAQSLGGDPGMTGLLTVRYRRPTPLGVELRLEGTLDRTDGRKRFTSGRLWAGDELTAEAEGLFIAVDIERMAELLARREAD